MDSDLQMLDLVNHCQISEMEKAGSAVNPESPGVCKAFSGHVRSVQAAIVSFYNVTAFKSLRRDNPKEAAELWGDVVKLCEDAIRVLKQLKDSYPYCGTPELYDLALEYWQEAKDRQNRNLQDAECAKDQIPTGLFPKAN